VRIQAFGLLAALALASPTQAQDWSPSRPDSHAPIGVMGDHTHEAGEMMLSFRYMHMAMDGNRDMTTGLTPADVLTTFPVTPLRMPMDMYMAGLMYAPSDRVTLMGMLPVLGLSMDHMTRSGVSFTTDSKGIGDTKLGAMITLA
jgi:hypothetical protein